MLCLYVTFVVDAYYDRQNAFALDTRMFSGQRVVNGHAEESHVRQIWVVDVNLTQFLVLLTMNVKSAPMTMN